MYHLIYPDWDKSIQYQGRMLETVIHEIVDDNASSVLDVSCGIGTQALALSSRGYHVPASDLSPQEVERAKQEATLRGLCIVFSVATCVMHSTITSPD